jgi:hypothetical protein
MRELALHILDLARNSLEAGATTLELTLVEESATGFLEITLRDNGRGMAPETLAQVRDPFYSTRTTRRWGLGVSLFAATCERCEGTLELQSQPGQGTRLCGRLRRDHWDCPPLGNMGAVIQALACEAEHLALRYRHEVQGQTFELDTQQLQHELGEVPLSEPSVLHWLGQFVNQELRTLGACS